MRPGVGDRGAAVRVAHEQHRAVDVVERGAERVTVAVEIGERSGIVAVAGQVERDDRDAGVSQPVDDGLPAPRAVPGTVHQHHRDGLAHRLAPWMGRFANPRTLPECTRVLAASSMS